jgi:formylglycine-generating enzyme required for sulfatase activity
MYKYIVIILCFLFTTSCNDNSSDSSSSKIEPKQLMPISSVKRLALIIGNADYKFIPSLSNPVNDAEDVADALRNLNYEVIVLTNANYQAMLNAVQQFAERLAQLGSVGLFYFSGHGLQTGGNNYLVPVDAKIKTEADIKPLSLNANHVLAKMNEAHSQVNVMILDACRDNPFEKSVIKSISSKGLAQIVAPSGSFISFATAPMQPAWGGKENERNSIYTKHLLAAMKNKPDVPVGDVLIGVRNQVMLETKDADAQQVPWDSSSLKHQFCFGECRSVDFDELKRQRALLAQQAEDLKRQRSKFIAEQSVKPPKESEKVINKKIFRDRLKNGGYGPEMVRIPAGSFKMGNNTVSMKSFYMGKYEVTFAEYDQFAEADGREKPNDWGWGRGNRPVINVSWHDATAYAEWLSQQTGETYRLPTEAEWEYAARAGTETKYWWGNTASHEYANYGKDKCCGGLLEGKDRWKYTSPVGSFSANPFGLYDTAGNVWEWTCSEYKDNYNGQEKQCSTSASRIVLRGGSWNGVPMLVRSDYRFRFVPTYGSWYYGFRLLRL